MNRLRRVWRRLVAGDEPREERGDERGDERGTAIVEFCYLSVLLMVPLVYILLAVFRVQSAAYGATAAAREAGRAMVADLSATNAAAAAGRRPEDAGQLPYEAARLAASNHELALLPEMVEVRCPDPDCLIEPGQQIQITVRTEVALPFVPSLLGDLSDIEVSATHREQIGRYRGVGR